MAELEGISLNDAFDMNIVHHFNDLVYLKNKDKHDEMILAHARNTKQ